MIRLFILLMLRGQLGRFKKRHCIFEIWQEFRSHEAVTALVEVFIMMKCQERTANHQLQDQRISLIYRTDQDIMFQPSYNVNKLFNRTVSWYFIDRLVVGIGHIRSYGLT